MPFHQTVLIIIAFYAVKLTDIISLQFGLILIMSFVFTILCYEIFRRFSVTCFMFGIKNKSKSIDKNLYKN